MEERGKMPDNAQVSGLDKWVDDTCNFNHGTHEFHFSQVMCNVASPFSLAILKQRCIFCSLVL